MAENGVSVLEREESKKAEFRYAQGSPPKDYVCGGCGASGVKLWREYNVFGPKLFCVGCACKKTADPHSCVDAVDPVTVGEDGFRQTDLGRTDQLGYLVPAVPDEEGLGYWGYTSVPDEGVRWWQALPLRRKVS